MPYEFGFLVSGVCFQPGSVSIGVSLRCGPCLPLYSSQGEEFGYICGKKVKGEKIKEKNKKVALGVAVFLLIRRE
jgi:hypothetical protein